MKTLRYILLCFLSYMPVSHAGGERIVSLSPALTELVCHLGAEKQLIGRSSVCNYPESVKKITIAGRFASPYTEKIIAMKPDLIVTNDLINPNLAKTFASCGIRCEVMQCRNIAEYQDCVKKLSKLLHLEAAGKKELERIRQKLSEKKPILDLNVLWVIWDSPLMVAGKNSFPDELLKLCGVRNAAGHVPQAYFKCSYDWLLKQKIDIIVWSAQPDTFKRHRFWQKLDAVKHHKVIQNLNHDLIQRPGPRIFEGVELLRKHFEAIK